MQIHSITFFIYQIDQYFYSITLYNLFLNSKSMKQRKSRIPQTGISNYMLYSTQNESFFKPKKAMLAHSTSSSYPFIQNIDSQISNKQNNTLNKQANKEISRSNKEFYYPLENKALIHKDQKKISELSLQNKIIKQREELYKQDIQNTKLVHFENIQTHHNQINPRKIKDIKRMIQRKYANRKKFFNIFTEWDHNHQGQISINNAHRMLTSMGININMQEAQEFVKDVSHGRSVITIEHFLDMVFEPKPMSAFKEQRQKNNQNLANNLQNKFNKKKITDLQSQLLSEEEINFNSFNKIISKITKFEKEDQNTQLKMLYDEFKSQSQQFLNKHQFLKVIKQTQINKVDQLNTSTDPNSQLKADFLNKYKFNLENINNQYKTLIHKNVNTLNFTDFEKYFKLAENLKIKFKKYFPDKKSFRSLMKNHYQGAQRKNQQNNTISFDNLKKLIITVLKNVDQNPKAQELQGLLNMFVYNQYGYTDISQLQTIIYDQKSYNSHQRIQKLNKGPPPPQEKRSNILQPINNESKEQVNLQPIIKKLEEKLFIGSIRSFQLFKKMDKDKDSFVSRNDFTQYVCQHNILNQNEVNELFNRLQKQNLMSNSNCMSYSEFSKMITSGMGVHQKNNQYTRLLFKKEKYVNTFEKSSKYDFDPKSCTYNQRKTRFNGTPLYTNIFNYNTKVDWGKAGDLNQKVKFQLEDKQRKSDIYNSKLELIRKHQSEQKMKLENMIESSKQTDECNLKKRSSLMWAYNHINSIKNDWY